MTYDPYYLAVETARLYLGNTSTQNIHEDMDEAAARYADGSIDSAVGARISDQSQHFGKAVGIAYLLYKVVRQNGVDTEAQRKLDWEIATGDLVQLQKDMVASGEIDVLIGSSISIDGGPIGFDYYETNPLNPFGKITFGARTKGGAVTTSLRFTDPAVIV